MEANDLAYFRHVWAMTQDELARKIGIGRRAYIELEMGRRPIRQRHLLALERISMDIFVARKDPSVLLPNARHIVDRLAAEKHH